MDLRSAPSPTPVDTRQTANPPLATHSRRHFLHPAHGLRLALPALQLSALADRVLSFQTICRTGLWTCLYRALRGAERQRVGRDPNQSAAIIDAQSVKTVEESGCIRGFDAHKWVKGRKRHLLVDTFGLPLSVYVTPADMLDTHGARQLLAGLNYFVPRLKKIWADAAQRGHELADWCKAVGDWELEVVQRAPGIRGFAVQPKRWVVERTFSWLSRNRRMNKDSERKVQTSETLIEVAMIRLMLARQGRRGYSCPKHAVRSSPSQVFRARAVRSKPACPNPEP
jgi:putative transposase